MPRESGHPVPAPPVFDQDRHGVLDRPPSRRMTAQGIGETTMTEIRVPTLGESVTEATIGRWFKKPGDAVAVDEPLVELETDKVTIEVPAPSAGTLGEISAKDGETVAVGALLGQINDAAAAATATPAATPPTAPAPPPPPPPAPSPPPAPPPHKAPPTPAPLP